MSAHATALRRWEGWRRERSTMHKPMRHGRLGRLHLVEPLGLLRGEDCAQLPLHLIVDGLHLGKGLVHDLIELRAIALRDVMRLRLLRGAEPERARRAGKEGYRRMVRVPPRPVLPTRQAQAEKRAQHEGGEQEQGREQANLSGGSFAGHQLPRRVPKKSLGSGIWLFAAQFERRSAGCISVVAVCGSWLPDNSRADQATMHSPAVTTSTVRAQCKSCSPTESSACLSASARSTRAFVMHAQRTCFWAGSSTEKSMRSSFMVSLTFPRGCFATKLRAQGLACPEQMLAGMNLADGEGTGDLGVGPAFQIVQENHLGVFYSETGQRGKQRLADAGCFGGEWDE